MKVEETRLKVSGLKSFGCGAWPKTLEASRLDELGNKENGGYYEYFMEMYYKNHNVDHDLGTAYIPG